MSVFCDGVFAALITVLVLELRPPSHGLNAYDNSLVWTKDPKRVVVPRCFEAHVDARRARFDRR
jgi:hypothetical protein